MSIDLTSGIVQILSRDDDIVGTGFLVSESGLIVTCAHVVQSAEAGPGDKLTVCFHKTGERSDALVVQKWWRSPDNEDVAILKFEGQIPEGVKSLPLGSSEGTEGHELKTFGFPNLGSINGLWGEGTLYGKVTEKDLYGKVTERGNTRLQIHSTKEISLGFSGAPLYDKSRNRVIGIIVSIVKKDPFDKLQDIVFAVPSEILRLTCSELEIKDICPYRGLFSFTEEDQRFFFGREKLVQELVDKLRSNPRFLAVTGSSGRGKSSVVSAGLLPRIRAGDIPGLESAQIVTFQPGIKPNESLENALDSVLHIGKSDFFWDGVRSCLQNECDKSLVIFVDQFEELFTIPEENERSQFIENLNNLLKSQLKVSLILTIRADFIEFLTDSKFEKYFNQGNVSVKRMSDDEFKEAITKPAKAVGLDIQAGLEKSLIEDLESTEDPLPLLEFTLMKLWEHQSNGQLTHESYWDLGGVAGAIGQWAGKVCDKLSDEEKELSKRIFTRLIHYGENGTKDSRRRLSLAELTAEGKDQETIHKLITKLADARLLVTDRKSLTGPETVEIIHDSLVFNWRQLREWISEDQSFLLWRQRLDIKVDEWHAGKESLLKDEALVEAKKWSKERKQELNHDEKGYIQTSLKSKEREEQELKEKEEQEIRKEQEIKEKEQLAENRRKKDIIKGLSIFSIVTLLLAGFAVHQWYLADEQKKETLALYLASKSETLQQYPENLDTSILLAIESFRICRTTDADRLIHDALSLRYCTAFMKHDDDVYSVVFSPDGEFIATASDDNTARLWDASTGEEIFRMEHSGSVNNVVFSPDGEFIATASDDNTARLWDASTGEEIFRMGHGGSVNNVVFSPDGEFIATASWDNTARLWDAITGEEVFRIKHDDVVNNVIFSPDGKYIATASWNDYVAKILDVSTGEEIFRMEHDDGVNSVVFSPDGEFIATASWDNTARLWDASTGEEIFRMEHDDGVNSVVFSPDGEFIATASWDNTARLWDASTGEEIFRIKHDDDVQSAVFCPDGEYIATASFDNTVKLWNTTIEQQTCTVKHGNPVYDVAFSPDGKYVATAGEGTAKVWNAATGKEICYMEHDNVVYNAVFSPDGEYIATRDWGNTASLWSASTGEEIFRIKHDKDINSITFSPDGKFILTASYDNTARLWDANTGKEIFRMEHNSSVSDAVFSPNGEYIATIDGSNYIVRIWCVNTGEEIFRMEHDDGVNSVVFSPDGEYIATASDDNTARLWDANTGKEIFRIKHEGSVFSVAFSPDGKYMATASDDNTAGIWDATTGNEICFMKHDSPVYDVVFSPNGKYIATRCDDNTARLWDATTGEIIFNMRHDERVNSIAFSPDGKYLATASRDSTAKIWIYQTEDIIYKLSTTLTRNLTSAEWKKYMGEESYHKTFPNLP